MLPTLVGCVANILKVFNVWNSQIEQVWYPHSLFKIPVSEKIEFLIPPTHKFGPRFKFGVSR